MKHSMKYFGIILAISFFYFLIGRLGLCLATINAAVSPVWPATGMAMAILFIWGKHYWPALFIGAFFVNLLTKSPYSSAFLIATGNCMEALCGVFILQFFVKHKARFSPYSKSLAIFVAAILGSVVSATIGALTLSVSALSSWKAFNSIWFTWWTGDTLGALIILPLVLAFFKSDFDDIRIDSQKKSGFFTFISLISLIGCGIILSWFLFIRAEGAPYLFFIFPFLLWCVSAFGEKGISVAAVVISGIGILSVHLGFGVFIHGSTNANLLNLQLFLASVGICSLLMSDLRRISSLGQPAFILLFSWFLAGLLFFGFYYQSTRESDKHFRAIIDGVEPMLEARLNLYFSALRSGNSLFAASNDVSRSEWRAFHEHGQYIKDLPGVVGVGVIFRVPKFQMNKFISEQRRDYRDFTYKRFSELYTDIIVPPPKEEGYIVTYLEPMEKNLRRIGLDIATDQVRKSAADLAMETGEPIISSSTVLLGDPQKQHALFIFFPFYKNGPAPINREERRERLQGWIYIPFYVHPFISSVMSQGNLSELSYSLTDSDSSGAVTISSSKDYSKLPSNEVLRVINIRDRHFVFHFKRSASFYSSQDRFASMAGAIASMISLFVGVVIVSLQSVKKRALLLADKRMEQLKNSEELWKLALQGSGDNVWDWNIATNRITFTNEFNKKLGFDWAQTSDQGYFSQLKELIHPEDLFRTMEQLRNHFERGTNYSSEFRMKFSDGSYHWFLSRGKVVALDEMEKPLRMVGTMTDITVWKNTEAELKNQKNKLNSIFEGSSDALMLLDEEGHFFDCNFQTLKLFGLKTKEEFFHYLPSDLSPEEQPDGKKSSTKARYEISKAFRLGSNRFEWIHKRTTGEDFTAEVLLTAFNYAGKKVVQACVRDITEQKLAEKALSTQREKLVASAKMSSLGEMAGGIAHEINNPLAIIIGKTTQLKRRMKDESTYPNAHDLSEGLSVIEVTSRRISSIIKGLSAFSRNTENDSMERILVPMLIQDTLEISKERFRFHSIDLRFDLADSEKTYVNGRAAQLLQVLLNLLNNAYDAVESLPVRWVEIHTETTDSVCRITVTDSGSGIAPEILDKIMSPFFSTKSVGKGTGLGLSISKGIIEDHKGQFYYDRTSQNTRFVIELPKA